jgi:hypothetical protein
VSLSMNLGQIRSETRAFLMNTSLDTNSFTWTDSILNAYINEATLYTQQVTQWHEDFDNIVCTASVSTYTAPAEVYQFQRMTWDRVFLPQTNEYELDRDDPSWRQAPPNNPFRFYFPQMGQQYQIVPYPTPSQNGFNYAPFSSEKGVVAQFLNADGLTVDTSYTFNQETGIVVGVADTNGAIIMFEPDFTANPFTTVSADLGELVMYSTDELNLGFAHVRLPDTMVLDTDTPQLPIQSHYGLVFYALMKCFFEEGEFQDLDLAKAWFEAYGDWMESVLENKARRWGTRVRSLEPFEEGSLFAQRLNAIGYPLQLDLKPSYGA